MVGVVLVGLGFLIWLLERPTVDTSSWGSKTWEFTHLSLETRFWLTLAGTIYLAKAAGRLMKSGRVSPTGAGLLFLLPGWLIWLVQRPTVDTSSWSGEEWYIHSFKIYGELPFLLMLASVRFFAVAVWQWLERIWECHER